MAWPYLFFLQHLTDERSMLISDASTRSVTETSAKASTSVLTSVFQVYVLYACVGL